MQTWKKNLYIMFVAQFFSAIAFAVMFPFLPRYVNSLDSILGLNKTFLIGAVYSAQAITTTVFSPLWGALADRFGKKLMVLRSMFAATVVMILIAFASSAEVLLILRAIQGMITGVAAASNAFVASAVPKERTGYAMGLMSVAVLLGVSVGPLVGGVVADSYGYRAAFFITASLLLIGGLLVLIGVKVEEYDRPEKTKKLKIIK
ncbi:MAG TPA: MFS transporter, partial [Trueperaceae bacterium]|nr:MFS transporter [Trueperaceae bacterium]